MRQDTRYVNDTARAIRGARRAARQLGAIRPPYGNSVPPEGLAPGICAVASERGARVRNAGYQRSRITRRRPERRINGMRRAPRNVRSPCSRGACHDHCRISYMRRTRGGCVSGFSRLCLREARRLPRRLVTRFSGELFSASA